MYDMHNSKLSELNEWQFFTGVDKDKTTNTKEEPFFYLPSLKVLKLSF